MVLGGWAYENEMLDEIPFADKMALALSRRRKLSHLPSSPVQLPSGAEASAALLQNSCGVVG
jgi:hypothetical protein